MEPPGRTTLLIADPVVSVVIPCYNAAPWIADAIESALAQTYLKVKVVVIDDGSIDGSREIIQSFDGQIKFELLDHKGAPHARNRGWQVAEGEFIQFLDADDILFPNCVARKIDAIQRERADIVYSGGFFFNVQDNAGSYESQAPSGQSQAAVVAHVIANSIVTTLLMCRKASLEVVGGFDENLAKGQEHDLLFRLAVGGFKVVYVPEACSLNRVGHNSQSITHKSSQYPNLFKKILCRFEEKLVHTSLWTPEVRAALASRFHEMGVRYLKANDRPQAIMMFRHARDIERKYIDGLPLSRRCLVPLIGGYLAERFLNRLRQIVPQSS